MRATTTPMTKTLVEQYALPPEEIERRSFALIESMLPALPLTVQERHIVVRVVHASGDPALGPLVRFSPGAIAGGVEALRNGCPIYTDVTMVGAGLHQPWLKQLGCQVSCAIHDPEVAQRAKEWGTTRAVAAMRHFGPVLHQGIAAIGNAPTALLALLDQVDAGVSAPALVVGVPVGFIAASESKEELMKRQVPFVSIPGYRGGSPIAAAILNAMLFLAIQTP